MLSDIFFKHDTFVMISYLGTDILKMALSSSINGIMALIVNITSNSHPDVQAIKNKLNDMDIIYKITIIGLLINEQTMKKKLKPSIKKALFYIDDILKNIRNELCVINKEIANFNDSYFKFFKSINCERNLETLEQHIVILDKRYQMFSDLLKIYFFE